MNSPLLLSLLTIIFWSLGGVASRLFNVEGGLVLYLILAFASLVFYGMAEFQATKKFYLPKLTEILSKKFFISSLGFGFYWLLISEAVAIADNASTPFAIQYVWVISNAVFFEFIFSKKRHAKSSLMPFLFSLIGFAGVLLVGLDTELKRIDLSYVLIYSLASGLCFGYFSAYCSTLRAANHLKFLIMSAISGMLVLGLWSVLRGLPYQHISLQQIGIAFLMGFLMDGVGSYFWTKANRIVGEKAQQIYSITIFPFFLPFISSALLYLFFDEQNIFSLSFILGLLIISLSSLLTKRFL